MNKSIVLILSLFLLFGVELLFSDTINSCGITISAPGIYALNASRSPFDAYGQNCINITTSNVTLNLNDSTVYNATGSGHTAIYVHNSSVTLTNITIANGTVNNSNNGIYFGYVNDSVIRNVTIYNNTNYGFCLDSALNDTLTNNKGYNNSNYNFYLRGASYYNNLTNNTASNGSYGFYIVSGSNYNNLTNNTADNNHYGFYIDSSSGNNLIDNTAQDNDIYDLFVSAYQNDNCNNIIQNMNGSGGRPINYTNKSVNWDQNDFLVMPSEIVLCNADYSNLTNITVMGSDTLQNNGFLILKSDYTNIFNSNSSANNYGFYLDSSSYGNIINNTANNNHYGFYTIASSNNNLTNNTVNSNLNGFYLGGSDNYNNITHNNLYNNTNYGFYLESNSYNNLTSNNISYSTIGIYATSELDDFIFNNTIKNVTYGLDIYNQANPINISYNIIQNSNYSIYLNQSIGLTVSGTPANYIALENFSYGVYLDNVNDSYIGYVNVTENNVNNSIIVDLEGADDNITVDGLWAPNGEVYYGIALTEKVSNIHIENSSLGNMDYGLGLAGTNITIENNLFNYSLYGVKLFDFNHTLVMHNNTFTNDFRGLYLPESYLNLSDSNITTDNTIDGKPIYFVIDGNKEYATSNNKFKAEDLIPSGANIYNVSMLIIQNTQHSSSGAHLNFTDLNTNLTLGYTTPGIYLYNVSGLNISCNRAHSDTEFLFGLNSSNIYLGGIFVGLSLDTAMSYFNDVIYLENSNAYLNTIDITGDQGDFHFISFYNSNLTVYNLLANSSEYEDYILVGQSSSNDDHFNIYNSELSYISLNPLPDVYDGRPTTTRYYSSSISGIICPISPIIYLSSINSNILNVRLNNFWTGISFDSVNLSMFDAIFNNISTQFYLLSKNSNYTTLNFTIINGSSSAKVIMQASGNFSILPMSSSEEGNYTDSSKYPAGLSQYTYPFMIKNGSNVGCGNSFSGVSSVNLTLLTSTHIENQKIYKIHNTTATWQNITNSTGTTTIGGTTYYYARADNITNFSAFALFGTLYSNPAPSNNNNQQTPKKTFDVSYKYNCSTEKLTIKVTSDGEPVENAKVLLYCTDFIYDAGYTDSKGELVFSNVDDVAFILSITKSGYNDYTSDLFDAVACPVPVCKEGEVLQDNKCVKIEQNKTESNSENNGNHKANMSVCSSDSDCLNIEYCLNNVCTPIQKGTCGYISNHKWINYECCVDSDCGKLQECMNHKCKQVIYNVNAPEKVYVGQQTNISVYKDNKPAPNTNVLLITPSNKQYVLKTDSNGILKFRAIEDGKYSVKILYNNMPVAEKSILSESNALIKSGQNTLITALKKNAAWIGLGLVIILGGIYYYMRVHRITKQHKYRKHK